MIANYYMPCHVAEVTIIIIILRIIVTNSLRT
jgi:hypothetical protein